RWKSCQVGTTGLGAELFAITLQNSLVVCRAFIVTDLFQPKARGRTVEQAEQGEGILLGGMAGQLNDRRRLLEHLPAAVEHEVVMCGDEGKSNGEGDTKTITKKHRVFVPLQSTLKLSQS